MTEPVAQNATANGPVAAAVLSCGLGCFFLGVLAVAADGSKALATALIPPIYSGAGVPSATTVPPPSPPSGRSEPTASSGGSSKL